MEKKGWIVRQPDAADRRVNRLFLSTEAKVIQAGLSQIANQMVDDALAPLADRDREQLAEAMRRIKRQVQAMLNPPSVAVAEATGEMT
jgi:DNA-binding MarR family transcriptional regulator